MPGRFEELSKKELSRLDKERKRLDKNLRGILDMGGLPHAIFVVDANREEIAVNEARKLGIPVIAIVDTNCDPDVVDYVIPGNDDALRAIKLFTSRIADAVIEGRGMAKVPEAEVAATPDSDAGPSGESEPSETQAPGSEANGAAGAPESKTDAAENAESAKPANEETAPAHPA